MNFVARLAPAVAIVFLACGSSEQPSGSAGAGGQAGATGNGGAGGGTTADPCEGIEPAVTVLTPEQLLAMLDNKDFALINVHVPYAGEIVGTDTHIPYDDVDAIEAYLGHDHGAKVVVYCRTGPMSEIASTELVQRGYCMIHDMPAALFQWQQLGYPTND